MNISHGKIEIGKRDWGNHWIVQLYFPYWRYSKASGFQILWDLLVVRINPRNNGWGLVVLGFGIGLQRCFSKPQKGKL